MEQYALSPKQEDKKRVVAEIPTSLRLGEKNQLAARAVDIVLK